jgi:hypothetical protein
MALRLERLEAAESIRQLAARYGVFADARNIEALVKLYAEDCPAGPTARGHEAPRQRFETALGATAPFRTTIHFVGNHMIELDEIDAGRAAGVVYCRAEHDFGDEWVVATLQYWDEYQRRDGNWLFFSRQLKCFYITDVLERPNGEEKVKRQLVPGGAPWRAEVPKA